MNNSIWLLLIITVLSFNHITSAQSKSTNQNQEENIKEFSKKVQVEFKLDDLQTVFIENTLIDNYRKKMELVQSSERNAILMEKVREIDLSRDQDLLKILSEEQLTQLKAMMKNQSKSTKKPKKGKGDKKRKNKRNL